MWITKITTFFSLWILSVLLYSAQANVISIQYDGVFDSSEGLNGQPFSVSYTYNDETKEIISFKHTFKNLSTVFTLADFTSVTVTSINAFKLVTDALEITLVDDPLLASRTYHVHWSDWSKWKVVDEIEVPFAGDADTGNLSLVPVPPALGLFIAGLLSLFTGLKGTKRDKAD